jgi:spore coat polysaccharide biosynthesis protein SpsF (cytidylyltransferase family)/aryl-alcohol dehydrogenase-like predicted oxidoreductase
LTSIVVIQARTNSTRLPGKVLLDIAGLPVVVLAAKRASNTGRDVIVATSSEETDAGLAEVLKRYNIVCYKGELEDTLSRYVQALGSYDDQTIVFRLTADNVVPDGRLLDEMEQDFLARDLDYLCCNGPRSGLPHGMSAEVTRLAHLREAHRNVRSTDSREHVTPYIIDKFGASYFEKYLPEQMGNYRCTIDCLDDYINIQQLFSGVDDPVGVDSFDLIRRLRCARSQPFAIKPVTKLVLGTAQFGMDYGVTNATGKVPIKASEELIKAAIINGAQAIDTARSYGDSEYVIGKALRGGWQGRVEVVTKLATLGDCPKDAPKSVVHAFVDASVYQSLSALNANKIDTMLLHRASHLSDWTGEAWLRLLYHKRGGRIMDLGVSVQNPDELELVLQNKEIGHVQLPLNLFDWRWDEIAESLQFVKANRKLKVHARSALLQGLLVSRDLNHWRRANVVDPRSIWQWLDNTRERLGRSSVSDLCISFVASIPWVDGVVIGVETMGQMIDNLAILSRENLSLAQISSIKQSRPRVGENLLDPKLWKVI